MAFAKDSPILQPLMQTINEMDKSGILKKIHNNYEKVYDIQCEERKVGTYGTIHIFVKLEIILYMKLTFLMFLTFLFSLFRTFLNRFSFITFPTKNSSKKKLKT